MFQQSGSSKAWWKWAVLMSGVSCVGAANLWAADLGDVGQDTTSPNAARIARLVDAAIADGFRDASTRLALRTEDAVFVRRAYLDLVGDIPPPEQVIAQLLDPGPDKRERLVEQLLESPAYGQNWARYWRDVVFFRAQEDRSQIAAVAMEADLAQRLNDGDRWDQIAARFITARGDVREEGSTAIIMAQDGRTEETTAEISRIFLGIQIQCAQCHDHPYDRWKREQFHELAAFFPRVGVRNVRTLTKRSFEVFANDRYRKGARRKDDNGRPQAEHRMPSLEDPTVPGKPMQPRFFLTGASLPEGTSDFDRRAQLAEWITSNPWFAIAMVNRMWSELVGEGFYDPIDDIGPDREASAPQALKLLADGFRDSGYDLKWLLTTICLTDTYQREARPRRAPEEKSFAANVLQPLRSDQLFNSLLSALEVDERHAAPNRDLGRRGRTGMRGQFGQIFGYDPSQARDSVGASIPQMLALMNSGELNRYIESTRSSLITRLIEEIPDDEQLIVELYLRCLSREPTVQELSQLVAYHNEVGSRTQVFEDLLWALLNSAEFRHRG
ncbi:MAG: DUF1549 and DUF1553 domain-containing protein [Pirellulales bacterium]|nr:DUF1549 and DUF1553 domain-containing protein [Pirellulales bacterium]